MSADDRLIRPPPGVAAAAFEALPHGVLIAEALPGGDRIVYANAAALTLAGAASGDLVGRLGWFVRDLTSDAAASAAIAEAMRAGRIFEAEVPCRIDGGRWCALTLTPLRDAAGALTHWVGALVDVTARRAAEIAACEGERRLRSLGDHLPNGVILRHRRHPDGSVTFTHLSAGIEAILGITPQEAERDPVAVYALVAPEDMPRLRAAEERAIAEMTPFDCEFRMRAKDGRVRWIHACSAPRRLEDGGVEWDGFILDETDHKVAEERLRRAEKMDAVGRLAGGVAHDFNNVLTVIHTCAELLRREEARPDSAERRQRLHDEIASAARRAGALTKQLLAFSRKQVVKPELLDLGRTVLGLETMLRRLIGEDIELVSRADPGAGLVLADAGQIEQVVVNLVVNARDAMPRGGRIEVAVRPVDLDAPRPARGGHAPVAAPPGRYVELSVADTGIGLDPDALSQVFEPFYTTKSEERGTGLGLATVHAIALQAGGAVDVESAPGRGATFTILLPRQAGVATAETPRPAAGAPPTPTTPPAEARRRRILVVEDEPAVRRPTVDLLRAQGFQVDEAADGMDALRVAGSIEEPIDLLLTDVVMPRMGGPELARTLAERRPGLRVLFTSGYAPDEELRERIARERLAFLPKPFTADALARAVAEALAGAR